MSGLIRLLENGAPFVVSSGGETVLHTAARAGQVWLMIVIVDDDCWWVLMIVDDRWMLMVVDDEYWGLLMIVDDETIPHTAARAGQVWLSQRYNMQRSFWLCLVACVRLSQVLSFLRIVLQSFNFKDVTCKYLFDLIQSNSDCFAFTWELGMDCCVQLMQFILKMKSQTWALSVT